MSQGRAHDAAGSGIPSEYPPVTSVVSDCAVSASRSPAYRGAIQRLADEVIAKSQLDSGLDSGYMSSQHITDEGSSQCTLTVSEMLDSAPPLRQQQQQQQQQCQKEPVTRLDSGVDLSMLSKDISQLNVAEEDLSHEQRHQWRERYVAILTEAFQGDDDGDTYLHLAIIYNMREVAMRLISIVPHPNFLSLRNSLLQTPLHLVVIARDAALTRHLVLAGADISWRDRHGDTPLHLACRAADHAVLHALVEPATAHELSSVCARYPPAAAPASTASVLLDAWNYQGLSCLHLAVLSGDQQLVGYLISHGASVNVIEGKSGRTPLHLATEQGSVEMVRLLAMLGGADVNIATYAGLSAYQLAVLNRRLHLAELLLQLGGHRRQPPDSDSDTSSDSESDMNGQMTASGPRYDDIRIRGQPVVAVK